MPSSGDEDTRGVLTSSKESLEEYRRIRREQDEEYAQSLQADQLKVFFVSMDLVTHNIFYQRRN